MNFMSTNLFADWSAKISFGNEFAHSQQRREQLESQYTGLCEFHKSSAPAVWYPNNIIGNVSFFVLEFIDTGFVFETSASSSEIKVLFLCLKLVTAHASDLIYFCPSLVNLYRSETKFSSNKDLRDDEVDDSSGVSASSSPPTAATPPRKLFQSKSTNLSIDNDQEIGKFLFLTAQSVYNSSLIFQISNVIIHVQ